METPRQILGIQEGESLKDAYRRRSKETHPDAGGTVEEFQRVKWAYDQISKETYVAHVPWTVPKSTDGWELKESEFQTRLINALKKKGASVFNCHGHAMQEAGWPDLWVGHPKFQGWIELKIAGGKLSGKQKVILKRLWRCRSASLVITQTEDDSFEVGHPQHDEIITCEWTELWHIIQSATEWVRHK